MRREGVVEWEKSGNEGYYRRRGRARGGGPPPVVVGRSQRAWGLVCPPRHPRQRLVREGCSYAALHQFSYLVEGGGGGVERMVVLGS